MVRSAAFSADGTRVVTASWDKTAKIWDAISGKELLTLHGHQGAVYGAAFGADGTRVVTPSKDNTVKVWDVALETRSPEQIAALVRCRAIFRLDAEGQLQEADPQIRDCPPQKRTDPPSRQLVRVQNLRASGRVAVVAGNLTWAQIYGQEAIQLSQEQSWQDEEAQARILLGDIAKRNADLHEAQSHYEKACALYHGLRWPEREALALRRLSDFKHENMHDPAAALVDLDRALALLPDDPAILSDRAKAEWTAGKFDAFFRDLPAAMKAPKNPAWRAILAAYAWAAALLAGHDDPKQRARDFFQEYKAWPEGQPAEWTFDEVRYALHQMQRPSHDIKQVLAVIDLLDRPRSEETTKELARLLTPPLQRR